MCVASVGVTPAAECMIRVRPASIWNGPKIGAPESGAVDELSGDTIDLGVKSLLSATYQEIFAHIAKPSVPAPYIVLEGAAADLLRDLFPVVSDENGSFLRIEPIDETPPRV